MTERFYPLGLPSEPDVWKTTYEICNEMKCMERSAYPPGTSVHQPGARDTFGYSTPAGQAHRFSKSNLGREPRTPGAENMMDTFSKFDVPEMTRSYQSPVASMSLSGGSRSLGRTRSLPTLERRKAPPRLAEPKEVTTRIEDQHFSYFVPQSKHRDGKEKLLTTSFSLSKLKKQNPISFPFAGEGTGFRCNGGNADWWPRGNPEFQYRPDMPTAYRTHFTKPGFYRASSPIVTEGSRFF